MASDYGEPASYLTLKKGDEVVSSDGEKVGTVRHVLADEEDDIFEGIVIDTHLGPGGTHFVDAPQVKECFEGAVELKIPAREVPELPKPTPAPAAMEDHADQPPDSGLQAKLHRAWDLISGKT